MTVLQLFLSSSKPVLRFAAVRTLNRVAMTHPMAVTNCNIDMESLISDANRSIATLAITTLLKTGALHLSACSCRAPALLAAMARVTIVPKLWLGSVNMQPLGTDVTEIYIGHLVVFQAIALLLR